MHNDSSRNPDQVGHDAPGVVTKPSEGRGSVGLTERLAAASARRARRVLAIWGIAVVVALILVGTSLSGLTTSAHVVGTTQASQAEALYRQALGASASQRPTDVIVVSSKSSTVSDGNFQQFVARLAAQVRTDPGVTHVATDLEPGGEWAWVLTVIAEHQAHAGIGDEVAAVLAGHVAPRAVIIASDVHIAGLRRSWRTEWRVSSWQA
jgi:hypothetical protein